MGFFDEYHGAMFGPGWKGSARRFGVRAERDVRIPMPDGVRLNAHVWYPDGPGRFPALLGFHCYHPGGQTGPIKPTAISSAQWRHAGQERTNGSLEAGDPNFFARRGYVHVVCNARGTGRSEGLWDAFGPQEVSDACEVVEWIAAQPWCDGNVGMFGVSYFARIQLLAAMRQPPHLRALFCPWTGTDYYRDSIYKGGVFSYRWAVGWMQTSLAYANCRPYNHSKAELGEEGYRRAVAALLEDEDIQAIPELVQVLRAPEAGVHPFVVDLALHPLYGPFWRDRAVDYARVRTPAYVGCDWGIYGHHLAGAFRSWEKLQGPKKMLIGPPVYLDRPLYQLHHEAVRWFDHWLKGIDTGIMDEPALRLFVMNTAEWKTADAWPLPETRFTPFYLHEDGVLSEREHWPLEGSDSFEDSPWMRGQLLYATPPLVENTEVLGPILLKLYAATTDTDIHWNVSLLELDADGGMRVLTKGWLKASHHRDLDLTESRPWEPVYTHLRTEPLTPGQVYEFALKIMPTGNLFRAGSRIGLRISAADAEPRNPQELMGVGTMARAAVSRITVFHDDEHPSYLLLPITAGNVVNTYFSGGRWPERR